MSVSRTTIVKCVIGGTFGPTGAGATEIWSTSYNLACYEVLGSGTNSDVNMGSFDANNYMSDHLVPFASRIMGWMASNTVCTFVKCNRFSINVGPKGNLGIHQVDDPTYETLGLSLPGLGSVGLPNFVSAGIKLTTTGGSRGRATHGRMFLPPPSLVGNNITIDVNGQFGGSGVDTLGGGFANAWDALQASDTALEITYNPSLVSPPKALTAGASFLCNLADYTTFETTPWVMSSRKNALNSGGTRIAHPTFA